MKRFLAFCALSTAFLLAPVPGAQALGTKSYGCNGTNSVGASFTNSVQTLSAACLPVQARAKYSNGSYGMYYVEYDGFLTVTGLSGVIGGWHRSQNYLDQWVGTNT